MAKCDKVKAERINKGTIETIVDGTFTIEGTTAVHIEGRLAYEDGIFDIVKEEQKQIRGIGVRAPTVYTMVALKAGEFEIEYQHLAPGFSEHPNKILSAEVYKVIVKPKQ